MKTFIFTAMLLCGCVCEAGETTTVQKFGSGTLTRRSNGDTIVTQRFGNGTLSRETFKSGKTATHVTQPFGRGILIRSSGSTRISPKK
jgi:hypothetical protein